MQLPERKIIRLQGYDYSKSGAYFVTFCTSNRQEYFGNIYNGEIKLSRAGEIADKYIHQISEHFPSVYIDEYIIMPDHIHILLFIEGENNYKLGNIIGSYKSACTKAINEQISLGNNKLIYEDKFSRQTKYNDRIIRNDQEYQNIKNYIINNAKNHII